ncbi:MAG TPA: hypothetical protein VEJ86_04630 [Candidatus Binataceae bacterium]|nr:hypothetical protein [Candidatus Binataceae bacterium]
MQSPAIMEYTSGTQRVKAREQLIAQLPASLRVDALSPLGVALVVVAHDGTLQIFDPAKNQVIRDRATAATLNRYVRIPMEPADAVRLLMGLAPAAAQLDRPADSVTSSGSMTVASWRAGGAGTAQLGFEDGALTMVRELASGGAVAYDVRYSDYRDIGGINFPFVVEADFPSAGSHLTLRYDRPIINGSIPPSAFVLGPRISSELSSRSAEVRVG